MGNQYIKKAKAIEAENKKKIKALNESLTDKSGIYFLLRTDEDGVKYFYIGQAKKVLSRLANHLTGYQHIDISLRKRGFFSEENPYGWKVFAKEYPLNELDYWEQHWILEYSKQGYQCRYNKTAGGQGSGKKKINDYRPSKGYYDGLEQGKKNFSKELDRLITLHLKVVPKNEVPTVNQKKALEKIEYLQKYHELRNEAKE